LEAKENLGVDTFTVWWIKAHNGRKLPALTITSVVAYPTLGTMKVSRIDYLVAKFKYDVKRQTMGGQGSTTGRWLKNGEN
jgi:hypothetical protein